MNIRLAAIVAISVLLGACAQEGDDDQRVSGAADYGRENSPDATVAQDQSARQNDPSQQQGIQADDLAGHAQSATADIMAEDIIGKSIVDPAGEEVGDVDSVVRDRISNEKLAVVGLKGVVGSGAKEVVIPLGQIKKSPDGKQLQTQMSRQQIEARPAYQESAYDEV
jgi:sporulation protein YlmC with PRC-barrel domain